jgi:hypothetical protein
MEKKKLMIVLGGAAVLVAGYFGLKYLSKPKVSSGIASPVISDTAPVIPGTTVQGAPGAPAGYGFNASANVYTWIGYGMPPNGAWTLPVS